MPFPNGRPNRAVRELRERTRESLRAMWLQGVCRALLAELLGCSEPALVNLMGPLQARNL